MKSVISLIGSGIHMAAVFAGCSGVLAIVFGWPVEEGVIRGLILGAGTGLIMRAEELDWIKPVSWKHRQSRSETKEAQEELARQREEILQESRLKITRREA
ncbi:MAG: hypothetical protein NCW75_10970 [Phycisphaera sp.]|nr:MAG: hypothetical protein NCW75_10970 [Phycisphaera sp.]